jgi:hypothetical protein
MDLEHMLRFEKFSPKNGFVGSKHGSFVTKFEYYIGFEENAIFTKTWQKLPK